MSAISVEIQVINLEEHNVKFALSDLSEMAKYDGSDKQNTFSTSVRLENVASYVTFDG